MANSQQSDAAAQERRSLFTSKITELGYQAGPMQRAREKNTEKLFKQFPELGRRVLQHPASKSWNENRLLSFDETLNDGFCARFASEFLVFDRREDSVLEEFMSLASARVLREKTAQAKVLVASEMVAHAFGGQTQYVSINWRERVNELRIPEGELLHVGRLMNSPRRISGFPGAGMCRHRSFLLKYLLDALQVCPCAAVSGVIVPEGVKDVSKFRKEHGFADHAWNCVVLGNEVKLLDVMNAPERLLKANGANLELAEGDDERSPLSKIQYYRFGGHAGVDSIWREQKVIGVDEETEVRSKTSQCWYGVDGITESDRPGYVWVDFVYVDVEKGCLPARKHMRKDSEDLRSV
eukprot:TRINITY_DN108185_c0_g1_i1.p1 TRINITY_DN108185_c0_g1~~TRINITY_DN108185_c0_g1_i1.p1  ORF type:complete len:352 (+),score=69.43 TRINITY_DN108185_c0_g1_i1:25-1080(+)